MTAMVTDYMKCVIAAAEDAVSEATGAPAGFGHDRSRTRNAVDARRTLYYILNSRFGISYDDIGRLYGFNRTTVLHLVSDTAGILDFDPYLLKKIRLAESILDSKDYGTLRLTKSHIASMLGVDNDKLIIID